MKKTPPVKLRPISSGTNLYKKLGIREGYRVRIINAPENYFALLGILPVGVTFIENSRTKVHTIHLFTKSVKDLRKHLPKIKYQLYREGFLWISWPDESSGIESRLTAKIVHDTVGEYGFTKEKVSSINKDWRIMKFTPFTR